MLEEKRGLISGIQSNSVHDGPGYWTLVFLSGCSFRCQWCTDPLGMEFMHGEWYSETELMQILNQGMKFFGFEGGVIFCGGEPLWQQDFILAVLKRCREDCIRTAIKTTAHIGNKFFMEAMEFIDLAFIDLKHMDPKKHQEKIGVSNELILENIASLSQSSWPGRLIIRIPIIQGFNDSDQNILETAKFLNRLGLKEVNIFLFHSSSREAKWCQLDIAYPHLEQETPGDQMLGRFQDIFWEYKVLCYVGQDTPFLIPDLKKNGRMKQRQVRRS